MFIYAFLLWVFGIAVLLSLFWCVSREGSIISYYFMILRGYGNISFKWKIGIFSGFMGIPWLGKIFTDSLLWEK